MENELLNNSNFIMYTTDDGQVEIEVRLEDENVWLTQKAMSELQVSEFIMNHSSKATIGALHSLKEKSQMVVSKDIKAHELEENQREGVSIDGE